MSDFLVKIENSQSVMSFDHIQPFSKISEVLGFFLVLQSGDSVSSQSPDPVLQFSLTAGSVSQPDSITGSSCFGNEGHHAAGCKEENPKRESLRVLPVKVVRFCEETPLSEEGIIHTSVGSTTSCREDCDDRVMPAPKRICVGRSQPVGKMDSMHQMSEETQLSAVWPWESPSTGEEKECDSSELCGDSQGSPRCASQENFFKCGIILGNDSRGGSGHSGSAVSHDDGRRGGFHESSTSTIGAVDDQHHAESGGDPSSATSTSRSSKSSSEDTGIDESKSGLRWSDRSAGRGHDGLGIAAQLLNRSLTMCLASMRKPGMDFCTDLDLSHWFISPLHALFSARLSKSNSHVFTWTCFDTGCCFAVWYDKGLSDDLVFSDFQDDWEFHVTKGTKKKLNAALSFLVNGEKSLKRFHRDLDDMSRGNGPTAATSELQEKERGSESPAEETSELQEKIRGRDSPTEETSGLQEKSRGVGAQLLTSDGLVATTAGESRLDPNATSPPNGLPLAGLVSLSSAMVSSADSSKKAYCICELFSPPRVTPRASKLGLRTTNPPAFDLEVGWDFFRSDHRAFFWKTVQEQEPDMILMSPDCGPFSILMNVNWEKMDVKEKELLQVRALSMLHFCIQVAEYQLSHGRQFFIEQPCTASSWATHAMRWLTQQQGVIRFLFDQCMTGLSVEPGTLSRKTTAIITNHFELALRLSKYQCDHSHEHLPLENGRPHKARIYPSQMVEILCRAMLKSPSPSFHEADAEEPDLEEMLDEELEASNLPSPPQSTTRSAEVESADRLTLSAEQKKKVNLLHVNLGHLPRDRMLSLLRAAGALPAVLDYVKNQFSCEQCFRQKRPVERRKAALPRTFAFNRLIGVDYFFLNFGGKTHAFLNVVCQGTNYQQIGLLKDYEAGPPSSQKTWKLFQELWLRPFGAPEAVICDSGSEFRGSFERSCEQVGCMQIITDSASPWQNGRVERHGGWIKERAEAELQSGSSVLTTSEDLELLLSHLANCKNRWFSRGGFSPCQLVFGQNPRVPLELLSDDEMSLPGWDDVKADPFDHDTAAAAFSKAHSIRQRARELCVQFNAREKIRLSSSGAMHRQRTWAVGQWVYVYRRFSGTGQGHLTRSRWIGPGIVVLQAGHSVWVSMRFLKCNSDQLRSASSHETLGAELARAGELAEVIQQTRSGKTGAIDVAREGSPPEEAWDEQGTPNSEAPILMSPDAELPSTPDETELPVARTGVRHLLRTLHPPLDELPTILEDAQSSTRTLDEPQREPSRQVSAVEPILDDSVVEAERKRQRTDSDPSRASSADTHTDTSQGRVRSQVSQLEMDRLEREAVRELRRLDRLERQQAALDRRGIASSSRDSHFTEQSSVSLFSTSPGLFYVTKQNDSYIAKPEKSGNNEFDIKTASPEELAGFRLSDAEE